MGNLIYPIGVQDFARIRKAGMVYVDKTGLIYRMVSQGDAYFLSRPRRFGKSLLVSTLKYYFEGRHDLFEGLEIDKLEKEWNHHEVVLLDMSMSKVLEVSDLHSMLDSTLGTYEEKYGITPKPTSNYSVRLAAVIRQAAARSHDGRAVVLIDEYDSPLLENLNDDEKLKTLRGIMRDFYSPLKAMGPSLRFVFLTGITKFSQLSIFSELNNLNNISMIPGWDALCGITVDEMRRYMDGGLDELAAHHGCGKDEMLDHLKAQYDGYHFSRAMVDVYNPFSLVKAFGNKELSNYWFESGTPTWLLNVMANTNIEVDALDDIEATQERFERPAERVTDAVPVLFQSGYLTIKGYDPESKLYMLGIPNTEVRTGLAEAFLQFINRGPDKGEWLRSGYFKWRRGGQLADFMQLLKDFYASIPYDISNDNERHYQSILYAVLTSFGADVTCEDRTSNGRADLVLRMPDAIYVIELKYGKTVAEAMEQLHRKDYAAKYCHDGRPVRLLGINLAGDTRTIDAWQLE